MTTTPETQGSRSTNRTREDGFAIPLQPNSDLGLAMLIAEDDEGHYEPVAVAGTIGEAGELAAYDFRDRMRRLERGEDPGMCPIRYKLWPRGINGGYQLATEIHP